MVAESTGISWARSTFNPWIGCTKVGPGCDHCYAEQLDSQRLSKTLGGGTSSAPIIHWGNGAPRYRTSMSNWNQVLKWNRQAAIEQATGVLTPKSTWKGRIGFWPVFCSSLADVFDNEVEWSWRTDLWVTIAHTPALSWLLVTKRIGNVARMVPKEWLDGGFPPNVRLLITVVNQEEADRDIPKLLSLPVANGISYEPALGPVDWSRWLGKQCDAGSVPARNGSGGVTCPRCMGARVNGCDGLEWIIIGGESAQGQANARMFDLDWARSTIDQCSGVPGVSLFVKQLGTAPGIGGVRIQRFADGAGGDPAEWPGDLRVQEFPV